MKGTIDLLLPTKEIIAILAKYKIPVAFFDQLFQKVKESAEEKAIVVLEERR